MTPIILIIFLLGLGGGTAIWFFLRHRQTTLAKETTTAKALTFRWRYIILPVAIFLLSILLAAYFYPRLPAEVAYHFKFDGTPDRWLSREMTMVWVLTPQLCLILLAGAIIWGITRLGMLVRQTGSTGIKLEGVLSLMGNIIALPQLIVSFAMLHIFSYNLYQRHIIPMWIFQLIILGMTVAGLGLFLALIISKARQQASDEARER